MKCRKLIPAAFFFLSLHLSSCVPEKGSGEYLPPEIVSSEAVVDGTSVSFDASLSAPRAESTGFVFWTSGGEKKTVTSDLSGTSFRSVLTGLVPGTTYQWYAFARSGESEVRTETYSFSIAVIPEDPPSGVTGLDIPDPYFRRYLLENFDSDRDGVLSEEEGLVIRKIDVLTDKISSLKGIEHFKNLDSLICRGTSKGFYEYEGHPGLLDSLGVSSNKKLRYLACDGNLIGKLDISGNPFLEELICNWNLLEKIDFSGAPKLRRLMISNNSLVSLDFKDCKTLKELECQGNHIRELDVSMLPYLRVLDCSPMDDLEGRNILLKLNVSVGQSIPCVTISRDMEHIPDETDIIAETMSGTVEGYGGTEHDP